MKIKILKKILGFGLLVFVFSVIIAVIIIMRHPAEHFLQIFGIMFIFLSTLSVLLGLVELAFYLIEA